MIKCSECDRPATFKVWGCCEYYGYEMCDEHTYLAVSEDWGAATKSCEPTESEAIAEYLARKGK